MGMTMTQKILAAHAGVDSVKAGDLITCSLDLVMANDITAPPSIAEFKRIGRPVFDKDKIVLVPDLNLVLVDSRDGDEASHAAYASLSPRSAVMLEIGRAHV